MSGYLQRLISNARGPRAPIRPVLPSPYAAFVSAGTTPALPSIEETAVSYLSDSPRRVDFQYSSASRQPEYPSAAEGSDAPAQPIAVTAAGTRPEVRETLSPLVAQAPPENAPAVADEEQVGPAPTANRVRGSSRTEPVGSANLGQPAEQTPERKPAETHRDAPLRYMERKLRPPAGDKVDDNAEPYRVRTERQIVLPESFRPLMAEERPSLRADGITTSNRMGSLPQRAVPTVLQIKQDTAPDEIQIHIGRIEVTALPPAPVRVAAPPVRRHIKLGEYLKRGSAS